MTRLPENFRRHVTRSSTSRGKNVELLLIHDTRQAEVGNQQVSVVFWRPEQQILRLEISVYDAMVMKIRNSGKSCSYEVGGIRFVVVALAANAVEELASERQIGYQVHCEQLDV